MEKKDIKQELKLMQNNVAMTVTLISFSMLFATLFLGFFLMRFNAPVWPPVEIRNLPQLLPMASTIVVVMSSMSCLLMETEKLHRKIYWALTFILGHVFLLLQWKLWHELENQGILVSNGMVPSMLYAFTWLHAAHIVLGLFALSWVGHLLCFRPSHLTETILINVGKFWHFLGVIWGLMYLLMFVF